MKTLTNDGYSGQINQCITLNNGMVLKSVLYAVNSENPIRYYLKYLLDDVEITREMFEIYKKNV